MSAPAVEIIKVPKKRNRRIPDDQRQKVSSACDNCKKRKFKCSGEKPCFECSKKGYDCTYTIIDKRSLRGERMAKLKQKKDNDEKQRESLNEQFTQSSNVQPHINPALPISEYANLVYQSSRHSPVSGNDGHYSMYHLPSQSSIPQSLPTIVLPDPIKDARSRGILTPGSTPNSVSSESSASSVCVPKSLQPLLSFPLENNNNLRHKSEEPEMDNNAINVSKKGGISNQDGKSAILLVDKSGIFRYMGETSPLSVLYEARGIFYEYVGSTKLTEDLRGCPVIDKPLKITLKEVVPLPPPNERDVYIEQFKVNINGAYFMFDIDRFYEDIVDKVYQNPNSEAVQESRVLLYFVLAIGSTYKDFSEKNPQAEKGALYFQSGRLILRDLVEDSAMWCVLCHYLQFHYYESILKKSTALSHLSMAINYAQSLGLHRNFVNEQFSKITSEYEYRKKLFRSLYISDRISSVFIGRPLIINDYDWDDPARFKRSDASGVPVDFNSKCHIELTRICTLVGRIVANFYQDKMIDVKKTKNLAIQLRLWLKSLDPDLAFNNILKPSELSNNEDNANTVILLGIHVLHLWAIMLLSRPFFMFEAVSKLNPEMRKSFEEEELSKQLCQAATKASILAIKLMTHYINTTFHEMKRMECYVIITCCFYASIILGITILSGTSEDAGYTENDLMNSLKDAQYIMSQFSVCNKGAERYSEINRDLISALINRHKSKELKPVLDNWSCDLFTDFSFMDRSGQNDVQTMMEFQQFFVSSDLIQFEEINDGSSCLPFDYNNYNLFFGDKL
ncbi:zinc cluster transcription factor, putative [Candida dubliniensis CD36]|uniref:Zinc cluster transcription factor, putative n=1 Tax=Candida dubliniensis (strain CD36 / ATCC MYA-646 / CBS 7987 / NCPF 3949 / NRRL Y-17841) TaxID=573826 RepID=B9WHS4_CANDC|nr:zinc cluster transcription factor, putative [Candida dubliniensis CD36]CAX41718.1 zinc cluster transcription factor, putative [Candida dubliniensis CD36]